MSTEPSTAPDTQPTTNAQTTEIAARGGSDPWADDSATADPELTAAKAPHQFDPLSLARMRNLMDDENAYCN